MYRHISSTGKNKKTDKISSFAFLDLVGYRTDAVVGDFGDVQQAFGVGQDLDKGAEIDDAFDLAAVDFAFFRNGDQLFYHLFGGFEAGRVR